MSLCASIILLFQGLTIILLAINVPGATAARPSLGRATPVLFLLPTNIMTQGISTDNRDQQKEPTITILGIGSLLSEKSSRSTFPNLLNFRLGRVPNHRRVFGHPASIFFQRNIANLETLEISSLSAEYVEGSPGFVCSVFDVPIDGDLLLPNGVPSLSFLEREEEFELLQVPFIEEDDKKSLGLMCVRSSDAAYVERWGKDRFERNYAQYGVETIWNWAPDSGIRPCAVYLRHCVLSAQSMGPACYDSFLDDTYLADRKNTIRGYLAMYPGVMDTAPPPELAQRYSG